MTNLAPNSDAPESSPVDVPETTETYVAGIMYEGRHLALPSLTLREQVRLHREPTNPFDPNAVKVERKSGEHFGYIPKELAARIAARMDADGQPIEATITELISDALGSNYRVRISFGLTKNEGAPASAILSPELEYHYEDNGPDIYVFVNGSEALFHEVKRKFDVDGMPFLRSGLCYRPAGNGHQYQWYLKIDKTSGATQERIERFFHEHFVITDRKRVRELEETRQRYQAEILNRQEELERSRQGAKDSESLAGEIDAERRQKIVNLESTVEHLQEQIGRIDDEKRALKHENQSLMVSLRHTNFDTRDDDIPESVENALLNVVGESLTLSQSLTVITTIFPSRIAVLETAWKSAEDSEAFRDRKKAFGLLWKLATGYWSVLASGRGDVDARVVFGEAYSAKESETVEHNPRARRLRTFTYRGIKIEMMRHLKIGVKYSVAETLRIHFEWDAESRAIVIGHCGAHLSQK